jgi:hypothetical protein
MLHVPDLQAETEEYPEGTKFARRLGHRTILAVPLIRDRDAIGAISGALRFARSPIDRLSYSKPSPTKPSSPSRTRAAEALGPIGR